MEKSIFNFKIHYQDGSVIDMHTRDIWVSSFHILSPSPNHLSETTDDQHGSIYLGTTLNNRVIKVMFSVEAVDPIDFDMKRDELFRIFNPLEKFYIIRDLQPGKRMEVSVNGEFDIDYLSLEDGEFEIEFVIHSVFLESVGKTLDPKLFDVEKWQVGQGLLTDATSYVHQTNTFKIFNAGDIAINPRQQPLVIKFIGASSNLKITNKTTGDVWQYNGPTFAGETLEINGIRSLKNGSSIVYNTNRKLISIATGWNDFEISGGTGSFVISFDFRFYYF